MPQCGSRFDDLMMILTEWLNAPDEPQRRWKCRKGSRFEQCRKGNRFNDFFHVFSGWLNAPDEPQRRW